MDCVGATQRGAQRLLFPIFRAPRPSLRLPPTTSCAPQCCPTTAFARVEAEQFIVVHHVTCFHRWVCGSWSCFCLSALDACGVGLWRSVSEGLLVSKQRVAAVFSVAIAQASFGSCGECGLLLPGRRSAMLKRALVVRLGKHIAQVLLYDLPCVAANADHGEVAGSQLPPRRQG